MKVNLGSVGGKKKYRHNLPRTVNTTSQFGFCQPLCCRELCAQDTVSVRTAHQVYLQPVAKPTFGRLSVKDYKVFVPIEDLYHPFASLLSGKSYSGALEQYIPYEVPNTSLNILSMLVYLCSSIDVIVPNTGVVVTSNSMSWDNALWDGDAEVVMDNVEIFIFKILEAAGAWDEFILRDIIFNFCSPSQEGTFVPLQGNVPLSIESADWFYFFGTGDRKLIYGRFTERGKNLRKILLGLGYQLNLYNHDRKSLLPLFAYYKAWFDLFAVQRDITWKDTNAYACLEYMEQSGKSGVFLDDLSVDFYNHFLGFLFLDLPECYYTQNPDFASAHISGTAIGEPQFRDFLQARISGSEEIHSVNAYREQQPVLPSNSLISQQGLDILKALYHRVNIATAVGGRIKDFMRAVFGAAYEQEDESNFIGATSDFIDITQVMNMAQTESGELGEYAGRGVGSSNGSNFKFTAKRQGYYIEMFALVPDARLAQVTDPNLDHIRRYHFFDPAFDGKTLLPTSKFNIYGTYDVGGLDDRYMYDGFGNIPVYTEYKVSFDTINGDMSMLSTRASFLPFTLEKLLPYSSVRVSEQGISYLQNVPSSLIVNGNIWRYIGLNRWLGNFDRIFVNEQPQVLPPGAINVPQDPLRTRIDDNFVCFFYIDMSVTGYQLPMADSFQTDSFGDHISVEKA